MKMIRNRKTEKRGCDDGEEKININKEPGVEGMEKLMGIRERKKWKE